MCAHGVFVEQKDGWIRCVGSQRSDRLNRPISRYGYRINTHKLSHTHLVPDAFKSETIDDMTKPTWGNV